ncbi:hypothetical protein GCM10010495_45500 [Kitasatospora herbaricolor]|nr:hypothetical protein GCM10010495_45500 [Kitasatospora herbaricolor]
MVCSHFRFQGAEYDLAVRYVVVSRGVARHRDGGPGVAGATRRPAWRWGAAGWVRQAGGGGRSSAAGHG